MSVLIGGAMSALGALLAVAGVRRGLTAASLYRNEATPVRRIGQQDGPVEFDGRVELPADDEGVDAPFSGEPAVCYTAWLRTRTRHRTDVEGAEVLESKEPKRMSNTEAAWQLAETDGFRRPFVVRDGGARVRVDPTGADLDITGHMGETELTVESGERLSDDVRDRLAALSDDGVEFDADPETWDRPADHVQYREARLEPGDAVHVAGATVESVPEEWGSGVAATVGDGGTDEGFSVSRGSESDVVRRNAVQFTTGVVIGLALLALGLHTAGVAGLL
ncbi:hypothetical protein [Halostella litorea]|uniref:hypothetical protein n=1 Tax=Halostella litorea TaxID=2528831 RepID=UPI0010932347|nr:hypothetical protein [Halostella litorea]